MWLHKYVGITGNRHISGISVQVLRFNSVLARLAYCKQPSLRRLITEAFLESSKDSCIWPAILILMLEADFSTPTKNVITLIMTE